MWRHGSWQDAAVHLHSGRRSLPQVLTALLQRWSSEYGLTAWIPAVVCSGSVQICLWSLTFKTLIQSHVWSAVLQIVTQSAVCVCVCASGHRNIPRLKQQTAAPCPLWWCVLPRWLATGWTKWASSAPKSTSTRCTTLGLLQSGCGKD